VPLGPIPLKDRSGIVFLEYGLVDVVDGAFVLIDQSGARVQVPVGGLACLMLEPGSRISHAAVALAARVGCLIIWVGEAGVRLYSAGQPGGARADRLLQQAAAALDETARLRVVRAMYKLRFGEEAPARRSPEQLRGLEGARVRALYRNLAKLYGVSWSGRNYESGAGEENDIPNRCISAGNACLYGLSEAAILAAGYAPAVGFLHRGAAQSFVFDVADLFKFETVVPAAFRVAARAQRSGVEDQRELEREVRIGCRDLFRTTRLLERIIPVVNDLIAASGIAPPEEAPEAPLPAHLDVRTSDDGHRG
jgi:CRISP-associated protein Cas1